MLKIFQARLNLLLQRLLFEFDSESGCIFYYPRWCGVWENLISAPLRRNRFLFSVSVSIKRLGRGGVGDTPSTHKSISKVTPHAPRWPLCSKRCRSRRYCFALIRSLVCVCMYFYVRHGRLYKQRIKHAQLPGNRCFYGRGCYQRQRPLGGRARRKKLSANRAIRELNLLGG